MDDFFEGWGGGEEDKILGKFYNLIVDIVLLVYWFYWFIGPYSDQYVKSFFP